MKAIGMRRWTRDEYDRMTSSGLFASGERIELVEGEILQMTPQGSYHATALRLAEDALRAAFGPAFDVRPQLPLALAPDSEPEPDLAVVIGSPLNYLAAHPATASLLVEVSDAALEFDRLRKGSLYAGAGIPEYWIVNLIDRSIEVYRAPHQGGCDSCQRLFAGDVLAPLGRPEAVIAAADILRRE